MPIKHLIIPDTQVAPGDPLDHFTALGNYIAEKQPDVIVHIGDHWDFPSLSSYDEGKVGFENRDYQADVDAGNEALDMLAAPIVKYNKGRKNKYLPKKFMTWGNHDWGRVETFRSKSINARFRNVINLKGCKLDGWKAVPFKEIIRIDGIHYSHFFYNQESGRPIGGSAQFKLTKLKFSFVMGHQQAMDSAREALNNGAVIRGLMTGTFYQPPQHYRGPQAMNEWRGIHMLHEVKDGNYDHMEVSLGFLRSNYL